MWWIPAMAAVGAIQGGMQARAQRKAQEDQNKIAAAQTEFSPWTGMGAGQASTAATPGMFHGALTGGAQGALGGALMQGQFGQDAAGPNEYDKGVASGDVYGPAKPEDFQYQKRKYGAFGW